MPSPPGELSPPALRALGRGEWQVAASPSELAELVAAYPVPRDLEARLAALSVPVPSSSRSGSRPRPVVGGSAAFLVSYGGDAPHLVEVLAGRMGRGAVGPLVYLSRSSRAGRALSGSARVLDLLEAEDAGLREAEELNRRFFSPTLPPPSAPVGSPARSRR